MRLKFTMLSPVLSLIQLSGWRERARQTECAFSVCMEVAVGTQQAEVDGTCGELIEFAPVIYLPSSAVKEDTVSWWI